MNIEHRLALPPLPPSRSQLAFGFGSVRLAPETPPRPSVAERFADWLGCDPATIEPDLRYRFVEEFRLSRQRRRPACLGQLRLRAKDTKPRSMGRRPTRAERAGWAEVPVRLPVLPATWGECQEPGKLPCPRYSCRYHLKFDINLETGALKDLYPDQEWYEMPDTCALEVASRGPHKLQEVGAALSVVMEHARETLDDAIDEVAIKLENTQTMELGVDHETAIARLTFAGAMSRGTLGLRQLFSGEE
jgi:hypothetical protein